MIAILLALSIGAPQRLAILPAIVEGSYGRATTPELFELVAEKADFRQGLDLVKYNALFIDGVEPIATAVRDCGSDVSCIARALRLAGIDLGLRVIANFALDPPLLTFNLIDSSDQRVIGEAIGELDRRALAEVIATAIEKLLEEGSFARGGRLSVEVAPIDALVKIDPPAAPNVAIAPGSYRVSASKEGYAEEAVSVDVEMGKEARVKLALDPLETTSIVESPWLWTGVGVGVAAVIAAVLIATNPFSKTPSEGIACVTTPMGGC